MPGTPRPVTDEMDGLLTFLAQQRDLLETTAHGLTDEQARSTSARSVTVIPLPESDAETGPHCFSDGESAHIQFCQPTKLRRTSLSPLGKMPMSIASMSSRANSLTATSRGSTCTASGGPGNQRVETMLGSGIPSKPGLAHR